MAFCFERRPENKKRLRTYIDNQDIACVPVDAGLERVLPFVHLREPFAGDDFVVRDTGELITFLSVI